MSSTHYDAIVVGLGGVGSFALRALAKATVNGGGGGGGRFLGIERASLQCRGHSSRGRTRIYRRAYFEHEHYVPWIEYSLQVFRDMQKKSGISLMEECGTLLIEPDPAVNNQSTKRFSTDNKIGSTLASSLPPLLASSWRSAQMHSIPVEYLNSSLLQERFPQFHYPHNKPMLGLLEPGGGFLRPERIMHVALQDALAVNSGNNTNNDAVSILDNSHITKVVHTANERIELHVQTSSDDVTNESETTTMDTVVSTNKLLVSMGAWTAELIPTWKDFLYPVRQVQGWIETAPHGSADPNIYSCQNMPCFVYISPNWLEPLYGIPCDTGGDAIKNNDEGTKDQSIATWLKVGIHKQNISKAFSYADNASTASSAEIEEMMSAIPHCIDMQSLMPMKDVKPTVLIDTQPCLYTMSPDKHFVIGEASPNVFVVAGLSGHGFKMTPALGQMMADYALGKDVAALWRTDFCSPSRLMSL